MKIPKFWIESSKDDSIELFVGEKSVGTFNHDEHGWQGMRDSEELFIKIANTLGVGVVRL